MNLYIQAKFRKTHNAFNSLAVSSWKVKTVMYANHSF